METPLPAIVIPAWQRPESLRRLLLSVESAKFPAGQIPLVLSVEGECAATVRAMVQEYHWPHGPFRRIFHENRLGLREHILFCGDLSAEFGCVIVLEDDLLVAPGFYDFAVQGQAFFAQDDRIAGIALYNYHHSEADFQPFVPLHDGADHYFLQAACSWGQCWSDAQWQGFRAFLAQFPTMAGTPGYPDYLDHFADYSWKKHFSRYLHHAGKTFVYPRVAHSTPFAEGGISAQLGTFWQVPLATQALPQYAFRAFDDSESRYDGWFEWDAEIAQQYIGECVQERILVNLRGGKQGHSLGVWILGKTVAGEGLRAWGDELVPSEMNVRLGIRGSGISLYRHTGEAEHASVKVPQESFFRVPRISLGILVGESSTSEAILVTLKSIQTQWPERVEVVIGSSAARISEAGWGIPVRKLEMHEGTVGAKWVRLLEALAFEWEMIVPAGVRLTEGAVDRILQAAEQFPHMQWVGGNRSGSVPRPLPQERWSKLLFQKRQNQPLQLPLSAWRRNLRHQISMETVRESEWPLGELWVHLLVRAPHFTLFYQLSNPSNYIQAPPNWRMKGKFSNRLPLVARASYVFFRTNIPYLRSFFMEGGHLPPVLRWDEANQRWFQSIH